MLPGSIYPRDRLRVLAVVVAHIESWGRCDVCAHVSQSCLRNCVELKWVSYNNSIVCRVVILLKVGVTLKFYLFRVGGLCTVAGCVVNKRRIFGVI